MSQNANSLNHILFRIRRKVRIQTIGIVLALQHLRTTLFAVNLALSSHFPMMETLALAITLLKCKPTPEMLGRISNHSVTRGNETSSHVLRHFHRIDAAKAGIFTDSLQAQCSLKTFPPNINPNHIYSTAAFNAPISKFSLRLTLPSSVR